MAKVSLRIYNRDIENLVDQGLLDEAVAHCSHILKTFPKHLETYRLLGKAYLEAKRYDEAVDIFQRVLVAVPDDFVSHVGMSIIRDDQGKPDDAIWHMERAFESQPSNAAIQGELRRLYGRRDGVEPPKIRMTRGALAHMYVQGELYPQAISEIKAVLGQDSQRADMLVLLALAYFRSGQKADASEVCNQLLKRPGGENCFEANRVMIELLQGSDMPEEVDLYRQRVNHLDPYAALAPHSVFQSGAVSDAAVTLERLEYAGQRVEMGTDWSSSGIGLGSTPQQQPDWLSAAATPVDVEPAPAASAPAASEEIPDFLRQAGWTESTGAAEDGPSPFSIEETPPVSESDLAAGDMPDWLKAMSPEETSPTPAAPEEMPSTASFGASSDWLKSTPEAEPAAPESQQDVPDWLGDLAGQAQSRAAADEAPITPEDTPTWLGGLGGLETAQDEPAAESPAEEAVLPDWLSSQKPAELEESAPAADRPSASLDTLGATAQEQDDAVAWLEGLAAKHGAKPEELVTDPNARTETPPEWVEQARALAESQAGSVKPPAAPQFEAAEESVEEIETIESVDVVETDELEVASEDETGIWLRGLAEKEIFGQPTESPQPEPGPADRLVPTPAEENDNDKPAWLRNLEAVAPSQPAPPEPEPLDEAVAADLPSWLQGLDQETPREDMAEARSLDVENELPGWLAEEEVAASAVPTTPADWQPVGPDVSAGTGAPESEDEAESEAEAVRLPQKAAEPARPVAAAAEPARPAAPPRPVQKPQAPNVVLETAQAELGRGDIPAAIEHYGKLIKKGRHTEEVIRDLREALYRYPVEVTVWQALGDAYMRANRLQEALDAYTKAEELLR